ncbi:hypothetical protein ACJRO7_014915 [Eucalyptus globulus]|uniref:Uncharacterized protein n=1 Tax=Eucalyptus globulus TaxID=34317 RepID=A0ABD3L2U6_EUCGL
MGWTTSRHGWGRSMSKRFGGMDRRGLEGDQAKKIAGVLAWWGFRWKRTPEKMSVAMNSLTEFAMVSADGYAELIKQWEHAKREHISAGVYCVASFSFCFWTDFHP